jgi:hypothetical protein
MMRLLILVLAAGAAGCAASREDGFVSTPTQTPVSITTEDGSGTPTVRVTRDRYVSDDVLVGGRPELWRIIPLAFENVGLPLPVVDPREYSATVQNHVLTRTLNRERLSNFLECGNGIEGPHADTHRITLNVRTWIEPMDSTDRSVVRTQVDASARNLMHGSSGTTSCSSRGRLELLIREELRRISVEQRLERLRR